MDVFRNELVSSHLLLDKSLTRLLRNITICCALSIYAFKYIQQSQAFQFSSYHSWIKLTVQ